MLKPWSGRNKSRVEPSRQILFLTEDEETKLFAQFAGRRCHLFPIIRFVLETGLRKGEFCRLEVGDVNLSDQSRFYTVNGQRIEVKPDELIVRKSKNGKPRTIPLTPEARRIAVIQMAHATTKKFLFTSRRTGGMISDFKTAFKGAVRDAGWKTSGSMTYATRSRAG